MMYYRTPDGEPTSNLSALIPHVINPQARDLGTAPPAGSEGNQQQ